MLANHPPLNLPEFKRLMVARRTPGITQLRRDLRGASLPPRLEAHASRGF